MHSAETSSGMPNKFRWLILVVLCLLVLGLSVATGYFWAQSQAVAAGVSQPAAGPSVKGADPYLAGPVKNTLRKNAAQLQQAWLQYLTVPNAKAEGQIEVDWTLDAQGQPSRVGVIHSDFTNHEFETAVVKAVEHMLFPPPGQAQRYVSHTFVFKKDAP